MNLISFTQRIFNQERVDCVVEMAKKAAEPAVFAVGFAGLLYANDVAYAIQDITSPGLGNVVLSSAIFGASIKLNARATACFSCYQSLIFFAEEVRRQKTFIDINYVLNMTSLGIVGGTFLANVGKKISDIAPPRILTYITGAALAGSLGIIAHLDAQQGRVPLEKTGILPYMLMPAAVASGALVDLIAHSKNR